MEDHLQHFVDLLKLLKNAGIFPKLRKCDVFQHNVEFLGHALLPGKLAIASNATSGIRDSLFPQDLSQNYTPFSDPLTYSFG